MNSEVGGICIEKLTGYKDSQYNATILFLSKKKSLERTFLPKKAKCTQGIIIFVLYFNTFRVDFIFCDLKKTLMTPNTKQASVATPLLKRMLNFTVLFLLTVHFISCGNLERATYFNDMGDVEFTEAVGNLEPVLQKNDILSITVSSLNAEAAEMFNVFNKTESQRAAFNGTPLPSSGYLIDQDGYIQFPFIGAIMAAGLTKKDLRQYITKELIVRQLLLEPIVDVRYLNFKVSVLGEVKNPAVFVIPNERVTLLEALGLAGDMTIYAKRDNVFLISERDGVKTTKRINLNTDELFSSPNYYLAANDVVYVQPNKRKMRSTSVTTQWLGAIVGSLSLAVLAITSFR